ncbi:MAG TPA: hypothetical protein VEU47_10915 [Candidatus Cybelea sp.]|nr:hypothetical protein [Candidatus Cybelea sp.]
MNVGPFGALAPMLPTGAPDAAPALPAAGPAPAMPAASAVPLPRPRPATAPAANAENANDETLPANAAPTQGQGPPGQPPAPVPETSLLGRIGHALQGADAAISPHTATLLALAGGLAGAPSWGTGISRGFTAAAAALPEDQRLAMQQGGMRQTFQALREQGVPPQLALASVYNPDILKSTLSNYVTDRQWQVKTVKDMLGNERLVGFNPYTQETKELSAGAGGAGGSQGSIGMLAPGVSSIDSSLTGDAYMAQFSPEVQAAARAYANGDTMPTGNPRQQGITTLAKTVAQKWGQDMNIPVNDATFAEKRKLKTDLASSGNSSMGGILSNGESSFSHLAELGESMSGLGNASHDFPGGGTIAAAQNYAGNVILPSSARKAQVKATDDNLSRYGQESTKFYAGSGGGETERMQARHDMNPGSASSEEMAAYLEKEKSLMLDRLNTKFGQIRQTLGEDEGNRVIAQKMPSVQQNIDRISASIQKLRGLNGGAGETSPAAAPMQINSKTDYDRLPKGATYVAPDGSMRTKQ